MVRNGLNLQESVSPGSIITIHGTGLSSGPGVAPAGLVLPSTLGNTQARMNGVPLALLEVNPIVIRAQIPYNAPVGPVSITVATTAVSGAFQLVLQPTAPVLLLNSTGHIVAKHADGSFNAVNKPALGGTVVTLYAGGLGKVAPAFGLYQRTPSAPASAPVFPITTRFGSTQVSIQSVKLQPGETGVYEVNIAVPQMAFGIHNATITVNGVESAPAQILVQPTMEVPGAPDVTCGVAPVVGGPPTVPQVFLPQVRTADFEPGVTRDETGPPGPVSSRYPNYNTSDDAWYDRYHRESDCPMNIGGDPPPSPGAVPTIPDVPNPTEYWQAVTSVARGLARGTGPVDTSRLPPIVQPGMTYTPPRLPCMEGGPVPEGWNGQRLAEYCRKLNASAFHGKDIIYVHGLNLEEVIELINNPVNNQYNPTWPANKAAFFPTNGVHHTVARKFFFGGGLDPSHINRFLVPRGGRNRFILIGYSAQQRLHFGVHAMLTQIAEAMTTGQGVLWANNVLQAEDPRGSKGFCAAGCILISHSTGGLVADVAMAMTKNATYNAKYGNIGFISDQVKVHAAVASAISGSNLAIGLLALTRVNLLGPFNQAACSVANVILQNKVNLSQMGCQLGTLVDQTILADLNPFTATTMWANEIRSTPVPTLTVAGASDNAFWPFKNLLHAWDDGVITMDSACGRNLPNVFWPSGIVTSLGTPLDPRLFDMGMPDLARAARFWVEGSREYLTTYSPYHSVHRAAAACSPWKSPWGMIEPVAGYRFFPTSYYPNHYSFVQTTENHVAKKYPLFARGELLGGESPQLEDARAILSGTILINGVPKPIYGTLVDPRIANMQEETVRGKYIEFKLFKRRYKLWIWKRTYHRLSGWQSKSALDYVYDYVL